MVDVDLSEYINSLPEKLNDTLHNKEQFAEGLFHTAHRSKIMLYYRDIFVNIGVYLRGKEVSLYIINTAETFFTGTADTYYHAIVVIHRALSQLSEAFITMVNYYNRPKIACIVEIRVSDTLYSKYDALRYKLRLNLPTNMSGTATQVKKFLAQLEVYGIGAILLALTSGKSNSYIRFIRDIANGLTIYSAKHEGIDILYLCWSRHILAAYTKDSKPVTQITKENLTDIHQIFPRQEQ